MPDDLVIDIGCQDSLVPLDPILEEDYAPENDGWRLVNADDDAEHEAPVCQSVGSPPEPPPAASSSAYADLSRPASSHGPDVSSGPRKLFGTCP